jgi:hypothetical protein
MPLIPGEEEPRCIVSTLVDALPSGSYVVATHGSSECNPQETADDVGRAYNRGGVSTADRNASEFGALAFSGLELVSPGIVLTSEWRPEPEGLRPAPSEVAVNAGVGRKP